MKYEVAKELKEAGWNFKTCPHGGENCGDENCFVFVDVVADVHFPTLEELIEACRDGFYSLQKDTDDGVRFYWTAIADNDVEKYADVIGTFGTTPDEAVARLYIELHKV